MDGIKDIVPDLLQAILDSYHDNISKNKELRDLIDTIKEGKGDYNTMLRAATLYGNCLSGAFAKNIDADILPDGKMYYNIAERLLTPLVKENYDNVAPLCMDVQQVLNKQNGINLQPVKPSYKVDKTKGIASYVSNGDTYNQRMWSFLQSLETNSKSIVDDSVKENCEFQAKSGMSPVIERHASAKACEWCQDMEGTYRYPYDVPDDVYKRHDNCNCTVVYKPDKRAKDFQDVWSKKWNDEEVEERIELDKHVKEWHKESINDRISLIKAIDADLDDSIRTLPDVTVASVNDAKNWNELEKHLSDSFSITMDPQIKNLNYECVKRGLTGFEQMLTEIPRLSDAINYITLNNEGVMSYAGGVLNFNPKYFSGKDSLTLLIDLCKQQSNDGYWVKGATIQSLGYHEAAHALETLLIDLNPLYVSEDEKIIAWLMQQESENIVTVALKELKSTPYGATKTEKELIKEISKYALHDYSETMAESFADDYSNGPEAKPLSKVIVKIAKKIITDRMRG